MALLLFPADSLEPRLAALLHPDLRREVADNVNRAILERQSQRREAAIRQLVRMRVWAENVARDKGKTIPERLDIGLNSDDADSTNRRSPQSENDHEPMITT
jgi:malonyl CoA-acyl carrier protein transacylase